MGELMKRDAEVVRGAVSTMSEGLLPSSLLPLLVGGVGARVRAREAIGPMLDDTEGNTLMSSTGTCSPTTNSASSNLYALAYIGPLVELYAATWRPFRFAWPCSPTYSLRLMVSSLR